MQLKLIVSNGIVNGCTSMPILIVVEEGGVIKLKEQVPPVISQTQVVGLIVFPSATHVEVVESRHGPYTVILKDVLKDLVSTIAVKVSS